MITAVRARPSGVGVEAALASLAGAATFSVVAVAVVAIGSDLPVLLLAVALLGGVAYVARHLGALYAVPIAMTGVLAYDWYYVPPTHPHELPDSENLGQLLAYLALAVLIGQIVSRAGHRAAVSDAARGELTEEQASLRRVATLVARGVPPSEVFAAVAREIGRVLAVDSIHIGRYESGDAVTGVASWSAVGDRFAPGTRATIEGDSVSGQVFRTSRPARVDDYDDATGPIAAALRDRGVRSSVGAPIVVDGRLWGVAIASSKGQERLPPDTESRIGAFTELIATAISNAQARVDLSLLAEEQASLRRVATLVAEGATPTAVFDTVTAEVASLLDADQVVLSRYESGDELTIVAHSGAVAAAGDTVQGQVRAPIVVDGRVWGMISASWNGGVTPPADTEQRMAQFAQLLDTAIANADSREALAASRTRLLTAGDDARGRVVRDLHDGAQQRFVHTIVTLKLARKALSEGGDAELLVDEALEQAKEGNAELRELAHGIMPPALTHGGLPAGVDAVVERLELPVHVDVPADRFPPEIEANAYFIVAEALTNVVKHAHAEHAEVCGSVRDGMLYLTVRDDGDGGADPQGHGLLGLADRAAALGGRLDIESPEGAGTLLTARLPVAPADR